MYTTVIILHACVYSMQCKLIDACGDNWCSFCKLPQALCVALVDMLKEDLATSLTVPAHHRGRGTHHRGRGTSQGEGHTSQGEGHTPQGEGCTPQGEGCTPQGEGYTSQGEGHTPQGEGHTSQGEGQHSTQGRGNTLHAGGREQWQVGIKRACELTLTCPAHPP